jgi:GWxTD domain-containing protein
MDRQTKIQRVLTAGFFFITALASLGNSWPLPSEGTIKYWVDGASFAGDSGRTWQEIYWSLPVKDFVAKQNAGQRLISYKTMIQLSDTSGKLLLNEDWNSNLNVPPVQEIERRDLATMDLIVANNLNPGDYRLKFMVSDLNGGNIGTLDREINVPFFNPGTLSISQIQVASDIYLDSLKNRFSKGKLHIQPHPSRDFGEAYRNLYYYFEVYRPVLDTAGEGRFVQVSLNSTSLPVINNLANNDITERTGQIIQTGGVNLDSFPEGLYILKASVKDGKGKVLGYSQGSVKVKRRSLEELAEVKDKQEMELQNMLREGGEYFYEIGYIASSRDIEQLKQLDASGKKEFLRRFWKSRDADPSTPENEVLLEHARRYKAADSKFGEKNQGGMKGSLTDRGRLYIKYGDPNEVESKTMLGQYRPVEIWRYYNGNKFVFVDKSSFGRYQLMYSKSKNERTDPNWIKYISAEVIQNEELK